MSKHSNTEAALDDIKEKLDTKMEEGAQVSVNMWVKPEQRYDLRNPFVFLFGGNFMKIAIEYGLTRMEILAVIQMLDYMQFGNLIKMSYAKLMRDIGCDPTNGSRVIKRLKEVKIIIEEGGNTYLNPHIAVKGLKQKDLDPAIVERGAEELETIGVEPNILTKGLKRKQKAKGKAKKVA